MPAGEAPAPGHAPLLFAMAWWGAFYGAQGAVAPLLADSFSLSDAEIARALGWIGCSALGALALGHFVDRLGRRRVLLACLAGLPLCALATAVAPSIGHYVAAQIAAYAFGTTLLSTVSVALAERLARADCARAHGRAGLAYTAATALPLVLVALLATAPGSWRWVWAATALPVLAWPWARRGLVESTAWRAAQQRGETARARLSDPFRSAWRGRALRLLLAMVCVHASETAIRTWLFYHAVRELGLDPRRALLILLAGGVVSLAGFRAGSALADRFGRRTAFAAGTALAAAGAYGFYGPGAPVGDVGLGLSFATLGLGGHVATVAFRSLATELFPTRVRGGLGGWLAVASATGFVVAMLGASAFAPRLGSMGAAVLVLVLLMMPAAAALVIGLPETAGLEVEGVACERAT
jgi:AAHS family benzoate transporter-like MFS transporter